jgi:hypothetical protein
MLIFYTMESIRDQVRGAFTVRLVDLPDNWNRYPCKIEKQCEAKGTLSCKSFVEIDINKPNFSTAVLEILFFRPRKIAFIRERNTQLRKLIELNIINPKKLVPVL